MGFGPFPLPLCAHPLPSASRASSIASLCVVESMFACCPRWWTQRFGEVWWQSSVMWQNVRLATFQRSVITWAFYYF